MGKLTPLEVRAAKEPGKSYADGDGLLLVVKPARREGGSPSRSWVLRIQVAGRRRDFGCGSADRVSLKEAREKAASIRREYEAGLDPVVEKRKRHAPAVPTFKAAAIQYHDANKSSWRNVKHRADWLSSLERYAYGRLGRETVDKITGAMIIETLAPIWIERPETARRVKQRIGSVLDWAYSKEFRATEAPMRAILKGLPKQPKTDGHFRAMPYAEVSAFIADLRAKPETMGRLALEFTILNAARSGEVRGATWGEIDRDAELWRIPGSRMKMGVEHVVPLSPAALRILDRLAPMRNGKADQVIFGGMKQQTLSDMTLSKIMRDAEIRYDVHGFRSSFRDWAGETVSMPDRVIEVALAHQVKSETERAYHRAIYLDQRRILMAEWSGYLDGVASNVVRLAVSA